MTGKHPLDDIVGARRPVRIGITVEEFRKVCLPLPPDESVALYSKNPRNRYGDWYEDEIERRLRSICERRGWSFRSKVRIGHSKLYLSDKIVDVVVTDGSGKELGLELKFLKGTGSLVDPKSVIDAFDFSNRSIPCLYCIDGPGWLEAKARPAAEYLAHWWEFTCAERMEETLAKFFSS